MSKCKAILDGAKITAIQVKVKASTPRGETPETKIPDETKPVPAVKSQPS